MKSKQEGPIMAVPRHVPDHELRLNLGWLKYEGGDGQYSVLGYYSMFWRGL